MAKYSPTGILPAHNRDAYWCAYLSALDWWSESDELNLDELVSKELLSDELLSDDKLDSDKLLSNELNSDELVSDEVDLSGILVKAVRCFWSLSILIIYMLNSISLIEKYAKCLVHHFKLPPA